MGKLRSLVGQTFGKLKVIREGSGLVVGKKNPIKRTSSICLCSCGNKKEIECLNSNLLKGTSTSCGCKKLFDKKYNFEDLCGQKFGKLTVLQKSNKKTKTRGCVWVCQCECGKTKEIPTNGLKGGTYQTCGDKINHNISAMKVGEVPLSHINAIKQNAIKRGLLFNISPQSLSDLFLKQNKKCAITNIELKFTNSQNCHITRNETTASLDRIDSEFGYIEGNVQWVHKDVNKMKSNHSMQYFTQMAKLVYFSHIPESRIGWDEYFLDIAFTVAKRSDDKFIQHGAILVDNKSKHIISTGYNNTFKGADTDLINIIDRENRRPWMIHAEENALLNSTKNPLELIDGATLYVTAMPCVNCLQRIINSGITKIVYADRFGSIVENTEIRDKINQMTSIQFVPIRVYEVQNERE